MIFTSLIRQWKELSRFKSLDAAARSIVFYAEDNSSWNYYEPIINELTQGLGQEICYVTSSKDDQVLDMANDRIRTFCIGDGTVRTAFFSALEADVAVMTMPDLGTYHIRRSKAPVHYVYVYHSMVSTHMSYRAQAFDQFDSILCVGPHHKDEIRAAEELSGLNPKILIEAGYGKLDAIMASEAPTTHESEGKQILLAPSWGEQSLLETKGPELIDALLETGHHITLRPHVMTLRLRKKMLAQLRKQFDSNPRFTLDMDLSSQGSMHKYDLLMADWGGSALEFAFGMEKPVLFLDVPRKVFNPDYEQISNVPMEVQVRPEIGDVVSPDRLEELPARINNLLQNPESKREQIKAARLKWIYNPGASGRVGAEYIASTAKSLRNGD